MTATDVPPAGLLEPSTFSGIGAAGWTLTLYPEAGEASVCRVTAGNRAKRELLPDNDGARAKRSALVAATRAKGHVRRYCRAMRCRFLWTLTTADVVDFQEIARRYDYFYDRLRHWRQRTPVIAVFEPHPNGHGWHVHFATDRFLSVEAIRRLWGHGHVFVGDPGRLRGRVAPRKLAAYLSKYVAKAFEPDALGHGDEGRRKGQHRYRLARGFTPRALRGHSGSPFTLIRWLRSRYGLPCTVARFSLAQDGQLDAWWFSFPDACLDPKPSWRSGP